jgi:transcriptional regulator with XRE-family HTH domain
MIDKSVPFIVRRARLILGMTLKQFGTLYGADEAAASQWERGLAEPGPEIWARIRHLTLKAGSVLDEHLVRVSPLYKVITGMEQLTRPIIASRGILEAIKVTGAYGGQDMPFDVMEMARQSPHYEISGIRALEIVQADPRWCAGDIVYAEIHCVSHALGGVWVDAMAAPLPDRIAAIIEFAPSRSGSAEGFKVNLIGFDDMTFSLPQ